MSSCKFCVIALVSGALQSFPSEKQTSDSSGIPIPDPTNSAFYISLEKKKPISAVSQDRSSLKHFSRSLRHHHCPSLQLISCVITGSQGWLLDFLSNLSRPPLPVVSFLSHLVRSHLDILSLSLFLPLISKGCWALCLANLCICTCRVIFRKPYNLNYQKGKM